MDADQIPDEIVEKAEGALHDIACSGTGVCDHSDFYQVRARAAIAAVWSDIQNEALMTEADRAARLRNGGAS